MRLGAILLLSFLILSTAAWLRAPEYDEAYSIFLTAGDARPAWPAGPFHPGDVASSYAGHASLPQISRDLRKGDVHPPLYFWLLEYWRQVFGPGWFTARMLSVLLATAALTALAWLANLSGTSPSSAVLIALSSYGFAYTGIVARDFALAQVLNILGMAFILSATRHPARASRFGLAGGLAFGAACFSNYLAVFVGLAGLLWLGIQRERRKLLLPAVLGFAAFMPLPIYFFLAQRNARSGQFQPFSLPHAIVLLLRDSGAAWFGGLPVYAGHLGHAAAAALLLIAAICAGFAVKNWQPKLTLFAIAAAAVPTGLLALGILFDNTPIEIRYLAFAAPFAALILAETLPPACRNGLLVIQALGVTGLACAPSTMQPQALAAIAISHLDRNTALVLLPFGNDGVGVPGPFIASASPQLRLQVITADTEPDLSRERIVILPAIRVDAASRQMTDRMLAALNANPCWSPAPAATLAYSFVRTCGNH